MGLKQPFYNVLYIVATYEEYSKSRVSIEAILNDVQVKPEECLSYFDPEMDKGSIIGTKVEFGINAKEHIELIATLKHSDKLEDGDDLSQNGHNFYAKLKKTKREMDVDQLEEKKK